MSIETAPTQLNIHLVSAQDADPEELDSITRRLQDEVQELPVESVERISAGAPPPGAKSAEAMTLGALAVTLIPDLVPQVVGFLKDWMLRQRGQAVKLRLESKGRTIELEYSGEEGTGDEVRDLASRLMQVLDDSEEPAT